MAQQTAVEWLFKLSKERELDKFDLEQAKQMEKEQIIEAHLNGFADAHEWPHKRTSHEYYNETYGNPEFNWDDKNKPKVD